MHRNSAQTTTRRPFQVQIFCALLNWHVAQCQLAMRIGLARFLHLKISGYLVQLFNFDVLGESYVDVGK
jgi:hypothetical protein